MAGIDKNAEVIRNARISEIIVGLLIASFVWTVIWLAPWGSHVDNLRFYSLFVALSAFPFGVMVSLHGFEKVTASMRPRIICGYVVALIAGITSFIWPSRIPDFCHERIENLYLIGFEYNHGAWLLMICLLYTSPSPRD